MPVPGVRSEGPAPPSGSEDTAPSIPDGEAAVCESVPEPGVSLRSVDRAGGGVVIRTQPQRPPPTCPRRRSVSPNPPVQESPAPGPQTTTGPRPVRSRAAQREVSGGLASEASSAAPRRSLSLASPPEPSPPPPPRPWKNCLPRSWSLVPKRFGTAAPLYLQLFGSLFLNLVLNLPSVLSQFTHVY